jgi:hypothetical protein
MDDELAQVMEFRNRFVSYANLVAPYGRYSAPDEATGTRIQTEKSWLMVEFGRLYEPLHRYGTAQAASHMFGVTSQDVLRDAISDAPGPDRGDHLRMAAEFLDLVVGRLQADAAKPQKPTPSARVDLEARSHWLRRAGIAAALGTILVAILAAVVTGWASAFFTQHPWP